MLLNEPDFLVSLGERVALGIQFEATRYAMGTLGVFFMIWVILAPWIHSRKIRQRSHAKGQIRTELFNSLRTVCVFVALDIIIFDLAESGAFRKYDDIELYGVVWYVLSIPVAIILHDAWFYWTHRAMHHPWLYKRFHFTHHKSHVPTPFTAYSFALGEAVVNYAFVPIMMLFMPIHGSALAIVLLIMIFKNALGHCGYEVFPRGTTTNAILKHSTTVTHHDMHHERATGNYALYFTWWDRWMGTEHVNYRQRFEQVTSKDRPREKQAVDVVA